MVARHRALAVASSKALGARGGLKVFPDFALVGEESPLGEVHVHFFCPHCVDGIKETLNK